MNTFHLIPAITQHSVDLGGNEYVAAPFAIPVLAGRQAAAYLDSNAGELPDLSELARALHLDADLGSDTQGLYVLPHLVDAQALARMLSPEAQSTVTAAMVADAIGICAGQQSQLDALIPRPQLATAPLAFVVGAVFSEPYQARPLCLNTPGWWQRSAVRHICETVVAGQLSDFGIATPVDLLPAPASGLREALLVGLMELMTRCQRSREPDVTVDLIGPDMVHLQVGTPAPMANVSISRTLVGAGFVEELLNGLAARLDRSALMAWIH